MFVGGKVSRYRILVGCPNGKVTLGRFGVHFSVSTIERYNSELSKGNLGSMLIIFC